MCVTHTHTYRDNKTFIKTIEHYVHDSKQSVQWVNKTKSRAKRKRKYKNQIMKYNSYNTKYEPTETNYLREETLRGLGVSPYLKKCEYNVLAKQSTLNMPGSYSIWLIRAFQTNFSKQREES